MFSVFSNYANFAMDLKSIFLPKIHEAYVIFLRLFMYFLYLAVVFTGFVNQHFDASQDNSQRVPLGKRGDRVNFPLSCRAIYLNCRVP
jgi:hypothetical protein